MQDTALHPAEAKALAKPKVKPKAKAESKAKSKAKTKANPSFSFKTIPGHSGDWTVVVHHGSSSDKVQILQIKALVHGLLEETPQQLCQKICDTLTERQFSLQKVKHQKQNISDRHRRFLTENFLSR